MISYFFLIQVDKYIANIIYSTITDLVNVKVIYHISNDNVYRYVLKFN